MPRILFLRFSSIGDIVLTSPVVRCVKQQLKDAEVHFLTKNNFASVIEHNPFIDKKIYFEKETDEVLHLLKQEKYDYVIDLHHNLRTLRLKSQLGAKSFSFNKLNLEKWLLVNFKINRLAHKHIVDRYMETVSSLGVINDGKGLDYFISVEDGKAVEKLPAEFQEGYTAFVIGAKHNTKKMPANEIAETIRRIDHPVLLLGGKEDSPAAEEVISLLHPPGTQSQLQTPNFKLQTFNACGKFSLNESAALIKHATRVISHDTGLMHIAAAFKKEVASIWGNTVPGFGMYPYYGVFEIREKKFEVNGLPCRPCSKIGFDKCPKGHFKCMVNQDLEGIAAFANGR